MKENKLNDELTLKEVILKGQEYFREVIRNWLFIVLITIPIVVIAAYNTFTPPVKYAATLTFMLNEEKGGGIGALGGLAASFGIGGTGGEFNLDKMLALSRSRNIIQKGLFEKITINKKEDFFANHIIDLYHLSDDWEKSEPINDFKYFAHDTIEQFSRFENYVLKLLHGKVIGDQNVAGILYSNINEETGIMSMTVSSVSEELSIGLTNVIYRHLSHFYITKATEQQKQTYLLTKTKTDSLRTTLDNIQYQLLKFKDTNRNLSLRRFEAKEIELERNAQILTLAYAEALKNQEIADFALKSKTPFIQSIDFPLAPLAPSKSFLSNVKNISIGGILGLLLSIIFIIIRKIIKDAMNSTES